jgi:hypothetical protein
MLAAKPNDLQRLGVIWMMHLGLLRAALRARLARQLAVFDVLSSVTACDVFSPLFFSERLAVRSHVSCMAGKAVGLTKAVMGSVTAAAGRLQSHCSTIIDIFVECHVKQGASDGRAKETV